MDPNAERDEVLMSQVALGHADRLTPLVRRHATPLLTFIARMLGDRHRAEEVFQEVFLTVWLKRQQYQSPRPFRPWLYAIALNRCRAVFRLRSPTPMGLSEELPEPADPHSSPVERAMAAETSATVCQAVAELPQQQRAVVALRVWHGLAYAEIAEIVECSESTARAHMHLGLAALRKALQPLAESLERV